MLMEEDGFGLEIVDLSKTERNGKKNRKSSKSKRATLESLLEPKDDVKKLIWKYSFTLV